MAFVIAGCFLSAHLERSLGTRDWKTFFMKIPQTLFSKKRLGENPFSSKPYWDVLYVDGNVGTLPYPHYWPVQEMLQEIKREIEKAEDKIPFPKTFRLGYLTNYEWMTGDFLDYKIWQMDLEDKLHYTLPFPVDKQDPVGRFFAQDFDFLILKTGKIFKNDFYGIPWADEGQALAARLMAEDFQLLRQNGFSLIKKFNLPDGTLAAVWGSKKRLNNLSLLDTIRHAKMSIPRKGNFELMTVEISGGVRRALYHHPVALPKRAELTWAVKPSSGQAKLSFGIAFHPDAWLKKEGDGADFIVEAEINGRRELLFHQYLDPKNNPEERQWYDTEILLPKNERSYNLILRTEGGPDSNLSWDHALWSRLEFSINPGDDA